MGIDFNEMKNKAQNLAEKHGDKIEQGVQKAGDFAKDKFGHDDKVDKAVDKIQQNIPREGGSSRQDDGSNEGDDKTR